MGWNELHEQATGHHGVVALVDARAAGIPPSTFFDRLRRQACPEPFTGVFLLPGWPLTGHARRVAAARHAGTRAVVTGASALALHGLVRTAPSVVELLMPDNARRLDAPRVRTRWTTDLPDGAVQDRSGVRVTDVARCQADHAADATTDRLRALAIDALSRGLLRPSTSTASSPREPDPRAAAATARCAMTCTPTARDPASSSRSGADSWPAASSPIGTRRWSSRLQGRGASTCRSAVSSSASSVSASRTTHRLDSSRRMRCAQTTSPPSTGG